MSQQEDQQAFHRRNRNELARKLSEEKVELAIISANSLMQASLDRAYPFEQDKNFYYLTGINEPGLLLVIDNDRQYLIIPGRSESRIAFEGDVDRSEIAEISGISEIYEEKEGLPLLRRRVKEVSKVGVLEASDDYVESMDMFTNPTRRRLIERLKRLNASVELFDLRRHLVAMRMIKAPYEIAMIEKAISHTTEVFTKIDKIMAKAKSEHEILAEITRMNIRNQLEFAYDPIIAGGINAVTLHYVKNNSKIDADKPMLFDIGLKYKGYCADITRTTCSKPSERQKAVYEAVLDVQKHAIQLLKPGITLQEYESDVTRYMADKLLKLGLIIDTSKEKLRKYYPHSTSHFLGLDVHDVGDYERSLEAGMVLTVEPGIYIPEEAIGVRIEDDILITAKGNKNLSKSLPRSLTSLTISR